MSDLCRKAYGASSCPTSWQNVETLFAVWPIAGIQSLARSKVITITYELILITILLTSIDNMQYFKLLE